MPADESYLLILLLVAVLSPSKIDLSKQVTPRKPRWVSTTADGSHFLNLRGSLNVINTTIQGMGDDCMNVHNDYFKVKSVNSTTVILGYGNLPYPSIPSSFSISTRSGHFTNTAFVIRSWRESGCNLRERYNWLFKRE